MKRFIYAILFVLAFNASVIAQPVALLKSVFIYNFGNMVEWQEADKSGDFIIGVLGGSDVSDELKKIAGTKKVGTQAIKVLNFGSVGEISKCHILVISEDKKSDLSSVLPKGKNTLIVSEESGAAKKGAGISFILVDGKMKFELNKKNVESNGLKVGATLEKLAINVQ